MLPWRFDRTRPAAERHEIAGLITSAALLRLTIGAKAYDPGQARLPAGTPGGGRWTSDGGPGNAKPSESEQGIDGEQTRLAGGFTSEQLDMTVQEFMSDNCRGSIRSVMPGEFMDEKIRDVQDIARMVGKEARTCLKLLK